MTREEVFAWLRAQKTVDFITTIANGQVILVMTRDARLVADLTKRGCTARWYDRVEFSTKSGKCKADQQCEVLLGPPFWARQEEEVATA
jgi:hypothetical protein